MIFKATVLRFFFLFLGLPSLFGWFKLRNTEWNRQGFCSLLQFKSKKAPQHTEYYNDQASLDCAREMMESFSLKCLEITKKMPKIQKVATLLSKKCLGKFKKLLPKFVDVFIQT